eukprot:tig00000451_g965.t1
MAADGEPGVDDAQPPGEIRMQADSSSEASRPRRSPPGPSRSGFKLGDDADPLADPAGGLGLAGLGLIPDLPSAPSSFTHPATAPASVSPGEILQYLPARLLGLPAVSEQVQQLQKHRVSASSMHGAVVFLDITGFSALARSFTHGGGGVSACEKLTSTLGEYFRLLLRALHERDAEVLLFAGDALLCFVPAAKDGPPEQAAARALDVALAVRAIAFERRGHVLTAHTGIGAGELRVLLLRADEAAAQLVYVGDAVRQACDALNASAGTDIVLSPEAAALLGASFQSEPARGSPGHPAPPGFRRLAAASPGPPPHSPLSLPSLDARCACGASLPKAHTAGAEAAAACGGPALAALAPSGALRHKSSYWSGDIRNTVIVFASFPELDLKPGRAARRAGGNEDGGGEDSYASRFGQVVRSVYRAAADFGGAVNKLFVDDKARCFGPVGLWRTRRGPRGRRGAGDPAALALEKWFKSSGAPFACGVASGRTFIGPYGAPCRKEYALIGDSVIVAARLMSSARRTLEEAAAAAAAAGGPDKEAAGRQLVLADGAVASAVGVRVNRAAFTLRAMPPVAAKGFPEPIPVFRPVPGPDTRAALLSALPHSPRLEGARSLRRVSAAPAPLSEAGARELLASLAPRRHLAPCFGREGEVEAVRARLAAAAGAGAGAGAGATLVFEGEAGYGKSLLAQEARPSPAPPRPAPS